jgi:hypothetical protein
MNLKSNEIELRGSWKLVDNLMKVDDIHERIESLTSSYLIEIGEDESGWNKLYQDPKDKRYWELSYPESEIHGGGSTFIKEFVFDRSKRKV